MTVASVWGASVLLGCAAQSGAPLQTREQATTPTLYLAAEKSVPTTKPTAWLSGKTEQSANHLQEQPQLPAGHPQIPSAPQGLLPAGHPEIPDGKGAADAISGLPA